jgi:ABC-type transport system involved in Fe-S cluster assembly fused permease/ATPase subunit
MEKMLELFQTDQQVKDSPNASIMALPQGGRIVFGKIPSWYIQR